MDQKEIREQAVRDAKVQIILDAARNVFADKGFHESRLEDIAAASGFSKAALYNYYEDKESIFLSLAVRDFDDLMVQFQKQIIPNDPIQANLERLLATSLRFFGEHFAFFLAVSSFQTPKHPELRPVSDHHAKLTASFHRKFSEILSVHASIIKSARARGEVVSDIDDETLANYVTSLLRSVIFSWSIHKKTGNVEDEARRIARFACFGICTKPA
jgi:AcrR family transcriptional regulator